MTNELALAIGKCLKAEEIEFERYTEYSGKGMFGKTTVGLVGKINVAVILSAVIAHAELLVQDGESMFVAESLYQDSMGLDYIVY